MNIPQLTLQFQDYLNALVNLLFPMSQQESTNADTSRRLVTVATDTLSGAAQALESHAQTLPPTPGTESVLQELIGALVTIVFVVMACILIWKRLETRKTIELAMIEKGLDPRGAAAELDSTRKFRALRLALLLVGTSLGLCVAMILWTTFPDAFSYDYRPLVALTSVTFFAGLALTVYHIIATSLEKH